MSELTLTLLRLGLLALLWVFIFSVVGVLRTDIYGTAVTRRGKRKAAKEAQKQDRQRGPARTPVPAAAGAGAAAGAAGAAVASRPGRKARGKGVPTTLVVTEGPLAGTSLPLRSGGILVGRNPECALVLDDDYASGRHCRIYPDPSGRDGWAVEDLGSTNGTFIGRDRLTGSRPVEVGTTLRIGKTVLELRG
ncbi:antibiotic biosynthesis regulator FhaB [Terrabacter aerolatus]|uniref:FHA domain-containing protein n=1 Tax=Terrabacter aerolatus TaxID=422442 RepID=A0A512D2J1_9MICO|nr:FHA domain-containing protein [Terrabacter aerolatus]GEO30681.1 FHA domain-containing protein [Terrabacter aerolatus]